MNSTPSVRSSRPPPHVALIDDDGLFRQMIRYTLEKRKGCTRIDEFSKGAEGLAHCLKNTPDLVIVDWNIPDLNGLEISTALKRHSPRLPILMLTAHPTDELAGKLMSIGVGGFLEKIMAYEHLIDAIDAVMTGGLFFSTQRAEVPPEDFPEAAPAPPVKLAPVTLSPAELQIARLVVAGLSSKEIALRLDLSARTVDNHRANIMRKIGVNQAAGLVRWCLQNNIVP